ncbi:MAG TPA: hypothetical protein VF708_09355 [Pyrinomonadaceae bacterium]|jgi:hypothetical protein
MPTKTERIVSYLPSTFDASAKTSAIYNVVDAFGGELLRAENSLAALMAAHWVDHADRTIELIDDLACIARLYGLAPRGAPQRAECSPVSSEESVEEFREHLKRYVRTFLEGTVTVQGILRVVAEVLNLRIVDDYASLDTWWTRATDAITTVEPRGDEAARALFGGNSLRAEGVPARPARIVGERDLSGGINLAGASMLKVKVNDEAPVLLDLASLTGKTAGVTLDELIKAINDAPGSLVAQHDRQRLTLASPTIGTASRLEVLDTEQDAATLLLGLAPYIYRGEGDTRAQVTGLVDLGGGADLSEQRYLRLIVDGRLVAEIDCAGADHTHTSLDEITHAINTALGSQVASHDGHFLRLTAPTRGTSGSIAFQSAAAQDARGRLFGSVPLITSGSAARPAEVVGTTDLSRGVDLSERARVRVRLDAQAAIIVNCVGEVPSRTRLDEIVAALATRLGAGLASHDGRHVHLISPTAGPDSSVAFEPLPAEQDATDIIFGIPRRFVNGNAARRAVLVGRETLSGNFNAAALNRVRVALDGGSAVEVDILRGSRNSLAVTLDELVAAFNRQLGAGIASHDGASLILSSPTTGSASSVAIEPLLAERRNRFVTRASILGEAAEAVFGFAKSAARGSGSTVASVTGEPDLSRGIDLREASFLRLAVDEWPPVDINCAGERPRATTLEEIIKKINDALGALSPELGAVASASLDGRHLSLTSPEPGASSRIAFEPPRSADALDLLLGLEPQTVFGSDPTRVRFIGTVDLRAGLNLSVADRIKLGIDGNPPVEISCANRQDPARTSINDIVLAINLKLNAIVAFNDGTHVMLVSQTKGAESRIEFVTPDGPDATRAIFGIEPPRSYHGSPAAPARLAGLRDLQSGVGLRVVRSLTVAINGGPPVTVDCAAGANDPAHVSLSQIVAALNTKLGAGVASQDAGRLILSSPTAGAVSQIQLLRSEGNDARTKILGNVPQETKGEDAAPAAIVGEVDLLSPLNLSERRVIRFAADNGRPFDVDIAGALPGVTAPQEIVEKINQTTPLTASITSEGKLRVAAATRGLESSLSLQPVRTLELIEYPGVWAFDPADDAATGASSGALPAPRRVRHGDAWRVNNDGATEADIEVELLAPHGTVGPQLLNRSTGHRVKLATVLRPGERVRLGRGAAGGLSAVVESAEGQQPRPLPREQIISGPAGSQAHVPYSGQRHLTDGYGDNQATLQLNDWGAATLDVLRARAVGKQGNGIAVRVEEARLAPHAGGGSNLAADGGQATLVGRVHGDKTGFRLTGGGGATLARLRAGPGVDLSEHDGRIASLSGALHPTDKAVPLMIVERVVHLFDVTLEYATGEGEAVTESYTGVRLGAGDEDQGGLEWQINTGPRASKLVRVRGAGKSDVLRLPRGRTRWSYFDCFGFRFDGATFESVRDGEPKPGATRFAGGRCTDRAVFNFSRFTRLPLGDEAAIFASSAGSQEPPVELRFRWRKYQPGAFVVNLPGDLPENFGGRFNLSRFGMPNDSEETLEGVFTEPPPGPTLEDNPNHLVARILKGPKKVKGEPAPGGSGLLKAEIVERVPLGFDLVTIPFRKPRALTGGTENEAASIYLAEKDVPGFIKLSAQLKDAESKGAWGNFISVAVRKAGPARFDVTVNYTGARFENARQAALGGVELPLSVEEVMRPGAVGVLQAKAAGVKAQVTRERARDSEQNFNQQP